MAEAFKNWNLIREETTAQTGLTLEVANPRFDLIAATLRLTDRVPELRVVLGHLQALPFQPLRELRRRNVSGLPRPAGWSRMPQQPSPIERMKSNLKIFQAYVLAKGRAGRGQVLLAKLGACFSVGEAPPQTAAMGLILAEPRPLGSGCAILPRLRR